MSETPQGGTTQASPQAAGAGLGIVDADIHHVPESLDALLPYLPAAWRAYVEETDYARLPNAPYPKTAGGASAGTPSPRTAARRDRASPCSGSRRWTPTG